jgi:two-component system response regulator MprA
MNHPAPCTRAARGRVLLIDDDCAVRAALSRALESEAYSVAPAKDDGEALQRLARERYDVVLLDLDLMCVQGWDAFHRIHAANPSLPIVLITARPDQYDAAAAAGASGIMEKPLSLPLLIQRIDDALQALSRSRSQAPSGPQM